MEFTSKKVLITGGASGIGKIMVQKVLEKGARVAVWDINAEGLENLQSELGDSGRISVFQVDISVPEEISNAAQQTLQTFGQPDILINNAGIIIGKMFEDHSTRDILKTMEINAIAPMLISAEFLPGMIAQNSGHICNIASSAGLISNPKMSVYAASKWACTGFSDSLRIEMEKQNYKIGVTTVTPFYITTGMFEGVKSIVPLLKPEKVAEKILRGIEKNKIYVSMPWSVRFVRFGQALMPQRVFDKVIGDWGGIYSTMDEFTGRKN